jgi:hypothetical protein
MTALAPILSSLELSSGSGPPDLSLLRATHAAGAAQTAFWDALLADAGLGEGRLKSRPGRSIELYADAVTRHAASGAIALSVLDSRGDFEHLSFTELDAAATACASAWSRAGLEPGQVLALAAPMGIQWLIAFAAALRLGLTVSCLGSFGEEALCRRLRALDPARIVFDPAGPPPPAEFAERALSVTRPSAGHVPPPRPYEPKQALLKSFSPVRAALDQPNAVSAETALLWGLRDSRFAYRVGGNDGLAMPGFSFEQHQPSVVLATLLSGARFVELPIAAIARAPGLLAQPFITTLGVSPALRDILRRTPAGPLPALRDWWRSVDEPLDWPVWQEFIDKNELTRLPVSNLLVDAASGGALLVSARRLGVVDAFVVPSPGVPFSLSDLTSRGPSLSGTGVFSVGAEPDPKNPGWFLLASRASEYLYGSTVSARRAGRVFPADELVECVTRIPRVDGACVTSVATGEPGSVWAFVLIVFVGALAESEFGSLARQVDHAVRSRLGADFVPDRVIVLPLFARRKARKLDRDWCERQWSSGFLPRKAAFPVFRRLTALRASLRMVSDDAG